MELLERDQFLDTLTATLKDTGVGKGCVVLVSGEAGIGKTSLVERFAEQQHNKTRMLWGGCEALFTPRPLGPLYDIARQARGRLLSLVEYAVPTNLSSTAAEGFTGTADEWHRQDNFDLWTLHAWIWFRNPDGVFAELNPRVP